MKLPRDLAGRELIAILCGRWDSRTVNQEGSHVTLETDEPMRHKVVVPLHGALKIGTLNSILCAVARHKGITREAIVDRSERRTGKHARSNSIPNKPRLVTPANSQ